MRFCNLIICKIIGHHYTYDVHVENNEAIGCGTSCRRCNYRLTGRININKIIPDGVWQLAT